MQHGFFLALGLTAAAGIASAQGMSDLTKMGAEDVLKLQIASGQDRLQLEEQLARTLGFPDDNEFEARRKIKTYVEILFAQSGTVSAAGLNAALPVREITYDLDTKTYQLCLPSSMLYATAVDGGNAEALVSFRFGELTEKDAARCPFVDGGFTPGATLGISNYMEINVELAQAEQIHNAIEAGQGLARFACDDVTYVEGRFDTGPARLVCDAQSVAISVQGGPPLTFKSGGNDGWITRSGGSAESSDTASADMSTDLGDEEESADTAATTESTTQAAEETPEPIEPGTILTETALELDKADRIAVQRRLTLLGYSTNGVDGVFGPGTRAAISQWQVKNGLPISGYLSASQLPILEVTSEALYQDWLVNNANKSTTSTTKSTTTKRKYYRGADGCLRTRPGNARKTIIPGQSKYCNQRRRGKR